MIVGFNFLVIYYLRTRVDVSSYTIVVYISYNMGTRTLPDLYASTLEPAALRHGYVYIYI